MTQEELSKLQRYIGKRAQGQTDEQVIAHIDKIDNKTPLSNEEWEKLLYPACANADIPILKYVLCKLENINNIQEFMIHTVGSQERRYEFILKRIEVLKILMGYIAHEDKKMVLSETLLTASWYGEFGVVKFLIENGADIRYKNEQDKNAFDYAKTYGERFKDDRLYTYLQPYYEEGIELGDAKIYYGV